MTPGRGRRPLSRSAPPILQKRDPVTGASVKRPFGPRILPALRVLARMRGLRGTVFDLFGRTGERRAERALIDEYEQTMTGILDDLGIGNLPVAVQLARDSRETER